MAAVRRIYGELGSEAARIAASTGYDGKKPFAWKDYPRTKARVQQLQERFVSQLGSLIMSGTSDEWRRSNLHQDLIVDKVLKAYHTSRKDARNERYYRDNSEALQAFQQRKERGMNLSDKLWDQSQAYREELQDVISAAIERGTDAITLSKQVSKYLQDFPSMQRDYKELYGKASKAQNCEYRSIRLARSEINMAYRTAEQTRWRQLDFVVGYEIKMSGAHPAHDVCDELAGKYPKDFKWNGWHPNCYTDKAMVLTNNGWKHFSDVEGTDAILSLNPDTRDVEWVKFVARQCYPYSGKMIRFFNKSLECVVTPEHQMVYLSKTKGDIRRISAIDYRKGNGAFYRTCEHRNPEEKQSIEINGDVWSFDDYCEFMGYWLADGSTQHTTGVTLCQKKGEPAWDVMISCLERLGYHYTINEETISFYRSNIVRYLKQFGNSYNKFIPAEILSASKRQMQIFLDAFIKCDGYTRKTKSFVGNRVNVFSSKNNERMYFTTSPHLAGDLCQLLIMLGKRPSFKIKEPVTITKKDGSIIKGNYPCFVISECLSGTSTVFDKEVVDYSGNVYDLTLEKNHIMYISYDGKCFWGSNCMCYEVPILKTEDEFYSDDDKPSANEVTDVPQNFKEWCINNEWRISEAKEKDTLPYFLHDNTEKVDKILKQAKIPINRIELTDSEKSTLDELENALSDIPKVIERRYMKSKLWIFREFLTHEKYSERHEEVTKYIGYGYFEEAIKAIKNGKYRDADRYLETPLNSILSNTDFFKELYVKIPRENAILNGVHIDYSRANAELGSYGSVYTFRNGSAYARGYSSYDVLYRYFGGRESIEQELSRLSENSSVFISIDGSTLEKKIILGDGRFKNSLETGTGTFKTKGEERAIKERRMFGLDDDADFIALPKYGFMATKGDMDYEPIIGWGYGDCYVEFKPEVKGKATITYGDSYDGNRIGDGGYYTQSAPAVSASHPQAEFLLSVPYNYGKMPSDELTRITSFSELHTATYVEAQLYGDIRIEDVDCIFVEGKKRMASIQKAIDKRGLDISVKPCQYDTRLKYMLDPYHSEKAEKYAKSLSNADVDALGDIYINSLCDMFAQPVPFLGWNKEGEFETWWTATAEKIKRGDATMDEKRDFLKRFYAELDKKEDGVFIKPWWSGRSPKLGGWTSDVIDEELLRRSE